MEMLRHRSPVLRWSAVLVVGWVSAAAAQPPFVIQLDAGPGLQSNTQALAAFQRAIAEWESYLSNPVRVNISADFDAIPSNPTALAESGVGNVVTSLDYTLVRDAMASRAARPGNTILGYLPTAAEVTANVPGGSFLNTTLTLTRANQKALGLLADAQTDTVSDGIVVINNAFSYTYDRAAGVATGTYDFQAVAAREIGRLLGFVSNVDLLDVIPELPTDATTLDLFRFGPAAKPATAQAFRTAPREMRPGFAAITYDQSGEYAMSTGQLSGDGNAAASWKDDALAGGSALGVMDPTLPAGIAQPLSTADVRAMELIGWNTPEPAGMLTLAGVVMVLTGRRRGRSTRSASPEPERFD